MLGLVLVFVLVLVLVLVSVSVLLVSMICKGTRLESVYEAWLQ